ncbi:hypothetical protein ACI79P_18940 [Blastococcus sp. SYSU DS0510]
MTRRSTRSTRSFRESQSSAAIEPTMTSVRRTPPPVESTPA